MLVVVMVLPLTCCVESLGIGQGLALEHERLLCHRDVGLHLHCKGDRGGKGAKSVKDKVRKQGAQRELKSAKCGGLPTDCLDVVDRLVTLNFHGNDLAHLGRNGEGDESARCRRMRGRSCCCRRGGRGSCRGGGRGRMRHRGRSSRRSNRLLGGGDFQGQCMRHNRPRFWCGGLARQAAVLKQLVTSSRMFEANRD